MQRVAVIAKLKPDAATQVGRLIEKGPPFSPKDIGFERHSVFVAGAHAVFVFEGGRLDQLLQGVIRDPSAAGSLREWEPLLDGLPEVAREAYHWERGDEWPEGWGE